MKYACVCVQAHVCQKWNRGKGLDVGSRPHKAVSIPELEMLVWVQGVRPEEGTQGVPWHNPASCAKRLKLWLRVVSSPSKEKRGWSTISPATPQLGHSLPSPSCPRQGPVRGLAAAPRSGQSCGSDSVSASPQQKCAVCFEAYQQRARVTMEIQLFSKL